MTSSVYRLPASSTAGWNVYWWKIFAN